MQSVCFPTMPQRVEIDHRESTLVAELFYQQFSPAGIMLGGQSEMEDCIGHKAVRYWEGATWMAERGVPEPAGLPSLRMTWPPPAWHYPSCARSPLSHPRSAQTPHDCVASPAKQQACHAQRTCDIYLKQSEDPDGIACNMRGNSSFARILRKSQKDVTWVCRRGCLGMMKASSCRKVDAEDPGSLLRP